MKRQAASGKRQAVKKDRATRVRGDGRAAREELLQCWLLSSNDQLFNIPASASELRHMRLRLPQGGYNAPQGEVVPMPAYGEAVMFGHEGLSKRRQQG